MLAYIGYVSKTAFLGFRVSPDLKKQLEAIAQKEERSVSQICEVLLRGGITAYKKKGANYLQGLLSKEDSDPPRL